MNTSTISSSSSCSSPWSSEDLNWLSFGKAAKDVAVLVRKTHRNEAEVAQLLLQYCQFYGVNIDSIFGTWEGEDFSFVMDTYIGRYWVRESSLAEILKHAKDICRRAFAWDKQ